MIKFSEFPCCPKCGGDYVSKRYVVCGVLEWLIITCLTCCYEWAMEPKDSPNQTMEDK